MTTSRNPGNAGIPMVPLIDWADFADPPPPVDWLVEGILPAGVAGDVFGPPNAGKSSLIYSLAVHIAGGSPTWFGRTIKSGRVVVGGGEHSGRDAHWRSAHRFVAEVHLPRGQFKEAQEAAARNKEDRKEDGSKKTKGKASTENGSGYDYYAVKNGGDSNPVWNHGGNF